MARLTALLGSVTPPGRLSSAIAGAAERIRGQGHDADVLDLGQMTVGFADGRPLDQLGDDSSKLVSALADADCVILATPVYRASLTGALKNALDLTPVEALAGKPVGIVAMGATLHHYLGAESHLRDMLAWFGAFTLPTSVYLSSADFVEGVLAPGAAMKLDQLFSAALNLAQATGGVEPGPPPLAANRG